MTTTNIITAAYASAGEHRAETTVDLADLASTIDRMIDEASAIATPVTVGVRIKHGEDEYELNIIHAEEPISRVGHVPMMVRQATETIARLTGSNIHDLFSQQMVKDGAA